MGAEFATPVADEASGETLLTPKFGRLAFGATPVERIASVLLFTDHHGGAVCVAPDEQEAFRVLLNFVLCGQGRTGGFSSRFPKFCEFWAGGS